MFTTALLQIVVFRLIPVVCLARRAKLLNYHWGRKHYLKTFETDLGKVILSSNSVLVPFEVSLCTRKTHGIT